MLVCNGRREFGCSATMFGLDGISTFQNEWMQADVGQFSRLQSMPQGYGGNGILPCITAGAMGKRPTASDVTFRGSAPINKGVSITTSLHSLLSLSGQAGAAGINRIVATGNVFAFSGSAPVHSLLNCGAIGRILTMGGGAGNKYSNNILASGPFVSFGGSAGASGAFHSAATGPLLSFSGAATPTGKATMLGSGSLLHLSGNAALKALFKLSASGDILHFAGSALLGGKFSITAVGNIILLGGSATTHSLAHLISTEGGGVMTEKTLALAVWASILGGSISAENALLAAGSAGDPWITSLPGGYTDTQAGAIMAQIKDLVGELHKIKGLNLSIPVTATPHSITAGDIQIDITGDGISTATSTRKT